MAAVLLHGYYLVRLLNVQRVSLLMMVYEAIFCNTSGAVQLQYAMSCVISYRAQVLCVVVNSASGLMLYMNYGITLLEVQASVLIAMNGLQA